jgi:hypothetical protein
MPREFSLRLLVRPGAGLLMVTAAASMLAGCTVPPTTPPTNAIPAGTARVAIQSQCAQNVITCTSSWPTATMRVEANEGSTVTMTASGFLVAGDTPTGPEGLAVNFIGTDSDAGNGAATITYSWSYGASDEDPCSLAPGIEFSTEANPTATLAPGFHYIRLTVRNDIVRDRVESDTCGLVGENVASFDFVELEVEVR